MAAGVDVPQNVSAPAAFNMTEPNMRCILNSGGMDSYITWWLDGEADNVFVDIGHKYVKKERRALTNLHGPRANNGGHFKVRTLDGASIGHNELPSGIIPNRNAYLILAASDAGYSEIMMGVLHGEINSDKSIEFMSDMQAMLDISWRKQYWNKEERIHKIWSPIRNYTKTQLVRMYLDLGGSPDVLLDTVSCYSAEHQHCGACPSCFKRWVALTNNNITQHWFSNPSDWKEIPTIINKIKDGTYSKNRAAEVAQALVLAGKM